MNPDLEEIAERAYDATESQDNAGDNGADAKDGGEQQPDNQGGDNNEAATNNQNQEEQTEDNQDSSDSTDGQSDNSTPEEGEKNDGQSDKEPEQKGMSDEDFEAEAKRRGFIKQEEKQTEEQRQQQRQQAIEQLNQRPEEISERAWQNMSPDNKLLYKSLPYINTVGKDGKTYSVKDSSQLPDGFEFADKKVELRFLNEMQAQELRAQRALESMNQYRQRNEQQAAQNNEAKAVVEGVQELQKQNVLPKFTAQPNTPEFDKDPAVVLINEILGFRQQRNAQGANLSVEDATYIYKAQHPEKFTTSKPAQKTTASDLERKRISGKIGSPTGGKPQDGRLRPNFKGMSAEEIADYYMDELD